jgi:hypothetical protein
VFKSFAEVILQPEELLADLLQDPQELAMLNIASFCCRPKRSENVIDFLVPAQAEFKNPDYAHLNAT